MRLICCSWGWDIKHLFLIWPWHWSQLQTFLFCYPFPTSQEKNMPSFWLHFMRMFEWSKEINLSQLRELRLLRKMQCLQLWLISNADFCIYMLAQSLKWFFFSLVKKITIIVPWFQVRLTEQWSTNTKYYCFLMKNWKFNIQLSYSAK